MADLVDKVGGLLDWITEEYNSRNYTVIRDTTVGSPDTWDVSVVALPIRRQTEELGANVTYTQTGVLSAIVQMGQPGKTGDVESWDSTKLLALLQIFVDAVQGAGSDIEINSLGIRFARIMQFSQAQIDAALQYSVNVEFSYES